MSREAVEQVLGKAMLDQVFREALFSDPTTTLQGFDLSQEELAGLKSLDAETLDSAAGSLDERISKWGPTRV